MRTSFILLLSSTLFSFNVSAMLPAEEEKPLLRLPREIATNELEEISKHYKPCLDDTYTLEEYYTESGANNAHTAHGQKTKKDLKKFIEENFIKENDGSYTPIRTLPSAIKLKNLELLRRFNKIFPYDNDLKVMLGQILLDQDKESPEGFRLFAHAIMSEWHQSQFLEAVTAPLAMREKLPSERYLGDYFINLLEATRIKDPTFYNNFKNVLTFIQDSKKKNFSEYINDNNLIKNIKYKKEIIINKESLLGKKLKNSFVSQCEPVLIKLNEIDPICFDVFLSTLHSVFTNEDPLDILNILSNNLYLSFTKNNKTIPSYLNYTYALFCLVPQKKYEDAIQCVSPLHENQKDLDEYYQVPDFYSNVGYWFLLQQDYERACHFIKTALSLGGVSPTIEWNFAYANILNGNYEDCFFTTMNSLRKTLSENEKQKKRNFLTYQSALQFAGKHEELMTVLAEEQAKAIESSLEKAKAKAQRQGQRAKSGIEAQRAVQQRPNASYSTLHKEKNSGLSVASESPSLNFPCYEAERNNEGKEAVLLPKEKKKTKGTADPQLVNEQPNCTQVKSLSQPLFYIENITTNKNAWDTFYKLFTVHPKGKTFDNEVQIPLTKIHSLFKAMKQEYDPSKAKGSHKKGNLNPKKWGSPMEEQMVVLTNKTHLKEYHIIHLREAFVNVHIVPNDPTIMKILKETYPDRF